LFGAPNANRDHRTGAAVKTVDLIFDLQLSASLSIGSPCINPLALAPVPGATL